MIRICVANSLVTLPSVIHLLSLVKYSNISGSNSFFLILVCIFGKVVFRAEHNNTLCNPACSFFA